MISLTSADTADGQIIDRCLFCSQPVYERQTRVRISGISVHRGCYIHELEFSKPNDDRAAA
jgi:hypothetical protein